MAQPLFLLDTSVLSQPLRKQPLLPALQHWQTAGDVSCATSEVCLAEIEFGLHKLGSPRAWSLYQNLLKNRLKVFPATPVIWGQFARLKAAQDSRGKPIGDLDLLMASTAQIHGLTLATLNSRHFSLLEGLVWEDWSSL